MFQTVTNAPLKPKEKHVFHAESPIWFLYVLLCVHTDETLAARVFNPGGSDGPMPSKGWERTAWLAMIKMSEMLMF